jgi:mannose/cellobiose epimerase-like protein (N-acyl-D-glucosamine 2-epimerase family)
MTPTLTADPEFSSDYAIQWLGKDVFPLWSKAGVDLKNGGFVEALSLMGEPLSQPRRAMVQARQIYSFRVGRDLGVCSADVAEKAIHSGINYLLNHYQLPSGAFIHSLDIHGKPHNSLPDLYTQAFALFGLANGNLALKNSTNKEAATAATRALTSAQALLDYLWRERRAPYGGFTELTYHDSTSTTHAYQSNPHMHLFEAAIAWLETSPQAAAMPWTKLAQEILDLCMNKFIDSQTGLLAEHFTKDWTPIRETNNQFIFEPGHQFEWAWLMGRFQKLTGADLTRTRLSLINLSERHGIDTKREAAIDQMWSDLTPKLSSARFWPQCERIKATAQMCDNRTQLSESERIQFRQTAARSMKTLFRFFDLPVKGLWYDTWDAAGQFVQQPSKASSLYHIIGAIEEYV